MWCENVVPELLGVRRPACARKGQWAVVDAQGQWSTVNDQQSMVSERCMPLGGGPPLTYSHFESCKFCPKPKVHFFKISVKLSQTFVRNRRM